MTTTDNVHLDLELHPSKTLLVLIITSHLLAAIALWLSALDATLSFFVTLAVFVHCVYSYRSYYLRESSGVVQAIALRDDQWYLRSSGSDQMGIGADLSGSFRLTSWFISVRFKEIESGRCHDLALFTDSSDPDQLRRFRTWLSLLGSTVGKT